MNPSRCATPPMSPHSPGDVVVEATAVGLDGSQFYIVMLAGVCTSLHCPSVEEGLQTPKFLSLKARNVGSGFTT